MECKQCGRTDHAESDCPFEWTIGGGGVSNIKEWWIVGDVATRTDPHTLSNPVRTIHVVEYAAFEAMRRERDEWKKLLEDGEIEDLAWLKRVQRLERALAYAKALIGLEGGIEKVQRRITEIERLERGESG